MTRDISFASLLGHPDHPIKSRPIPIENQPIICCSTLIQIHPDSIKSRHFQFPVKPINPNPLNHIRVNLLEKSPSIPMKTRLNPFCMLSR